MNRRRFLRSSVAAAIAASVYSQSASAAQIARLTQLVSDINAVTGEGAEVTLAESSVKDLAASLRGNLLMPGSEAYDQARLLLDPSFDKYPALVVQPTGPADVMNAVAFAKDNDLLLAVKCGGHSASGQSTCDGGMLLDLSTLRSVHVDPVAKTARVAGGSLLGELDHESMAHGLVTTAGTVSHTGVGGLTLGGGFGRLARRYGLSLDNVIEFDVVTADGKLRTANAGRNADLYWALRGGGGNFGVVTSFVFQLHPMQREVVTGTFYYPMEEAKQVMAFFGEYADSAPDELHVGGGLIGPMGRDAFVGIGLVWSGDPDKMEKLVAPVRKAGTVFREEVASVDYVALQRSGDVSDPRANSGYLKSGFIGKLTPAIVADLVDNFEHRPDRATRVVFQQSGGAIGRVAPDATAFAHRESKHNMLSFVQWRFGQDSAEHVDYIKAHWEHMEPHTRGFYTNDLFEESQAMVNANYRGNYERLAKLKGRYDPSNLFRLNANIPPAA